MSTKQFTGNTTLQRITQATKAVAGDESAPYGAVELTAGELAGTHVIPMGAALFAQLSAVATFIGASITVDAGGLTGELAGAVTLGNHSTDNLAEGATRLYYTDARADARITAALSAQTLMPYSAGLASLGALATAADRIAYTTAIDTWAEAPVSATGLALIAAADQAAGRTAIAAAAASDLATHTARTDNPHSVTAAQLGAATTAQLSAHTSDAANPHAVTAAQLGLGSVENTALSSWAGSVQLVTVGTIGTGTWNATAIGATYGGTGRSSVTAGAVLIGAVGGGAWDELTPTTDGEVLQLSGGAPVWGESPAMAWAMAALGLAA